MMSSFNVEMEMDIVWNPLKVLSAKEQADINYTKSQTAANLDNIGAIGEVDERERISKDKLSGYSGVEVLTTDLDPVKTDDKDEDKEDQE
jgi:hypothetical protein